MLVTWIYLSVQHIGQSLRQGGPKNLVERFEEALHDPSAQLTYSVLAVFFILLFTKLHSSHRMDIWDVNMMLKRESFCM